MVRTLREIGWRAPWPFMKNRASGIRKIGPAVTEGHKWPGQQSEFTDLNIDYKGPGNRSKDRGKSMDVNAMWGFTRPYPTGYTDPNTKQFVEPSEMLPELVVPDLTGFELGPYVSFRTDVEIEKKLRNYEELVAKKGSEEEADKSTLTPEQRWPPPKMDAKTLFDLFYAEKVREAYIAAQKRKKEE